MPLYASQREPRGSHNGDLSEILGQTSVPNIEVNNVILNGKTVDHQIVFTALELGGIRYCDRSQAGIGAGP
jgi:hypothetical protein